MLFRPLRHDKIDIHPPTSQRLASIGRKICVDSWLSNEKAAVPRRSHARLPIWVDTTELEIISMAAIGDD